MRLEEINGLQIVQVSLPMPKHYNNCVMDNTVQMHTTYLFSNSYITSRLRFMQLRLNLEPSYKLHSVFKEPMYVQPCMIADKETNPVHRIVHTRLRLHSLCT